MRFVRPTIALAALALVAAACGGGARAAGSSASSSESTAEDAMLEFAQCMREHGVDIDADADENGRVRISIGGPGVDESDGGSKDAPDPAVEEAMRACEDKLPKQGGNLTPEQRAQMEDAMLEFAECMREHGIDMPDPGEGGFFQKQTDGSGGSSAGNNLSGPDPDSEEFRAAEEACEHLLPGDIRREERSTEANT